MTADRCGTYAGYSDHKSKGTPVCPGCRRANADYMREWRRRPENQPRLRAAAAARHRALARLAAEHPERFRQLLAEEEA